MMKQMTWRHRGADGRTDRFRRPGRATLGAVAMSAATVALLLPVGVSDARQSRGSDPGSELVEIPSRNRSMPGLTANVTPLNGGVQPISAGTCPQELVTYSGHNFDLNDPDPVIMQAGFVENEIAAVSITVDAVEFPVIINLAEMIFAHQATVTTTTAYTVLFWEGTPDSGLLVDSFSSDGEILPHIVMPPGNQAVLVQVGVDPDDPEQIVIQDNGSHTFSVGFRIDEHNNPPSSSCGFGIPAMCCPPPENSNAFPTTDPPGPPNGEPDFLEENWLYCLPGCELSGFGCVGGWHAFADLPNGDLIDFRPSGDWNIRVTYTPFDCIIENGACCLPDGTCQDNVDEPVCLDEGGIFQGNESMCAAVQCPDPVGACCFGGGAGTCVNGLTEVECVVDEAGFWFGPGTTCSGPNCPSGACCFDDGCSTLSPVNCEIAEGDWAGAGTDCDTFQCNIGACCLDNGDCLQDTEENCLAIPGAAFAGVGVDCIDANCDPLGACCLSNGSCLLDTQGNCNDIPGASWAGADTDCETGCAADDCPADIAEADNQVNTSDLLLLLGNWGSDGDGADIAEPTDIVDTADLLQLLSAWGPCR